jgi:hypothetical protein
MNSRQGAIILLFPEQAEFVGFFLLFDKHIDLVLHHIS